MDSLTRKRIFTNLKNGESFRFFVDDQRFGWATRFVAFTPPKKKWLRWQINCFARSSRPWDVFVFFFVVWIPKNLRVEALLATHYGIIYLLAVFGCISWQTATRKDICESCRCIFSCLERFPKEYGNGFLEKGHFNKGQDSIQWEIPEISKQSGFYKMECWGTWVVKMLFSSWGTSGIYIFRCSRQALSFHVLGEFASSQKPHDSGRTTCLALIQVDDGWNKFCPSLLFWVRFPRAHVFMGSKNRRNCGDT